MRWSRAEVETPKNRSGALQTQAVFQKQFEQEREQPRPDICGYGQMAAAFQSQLEGALRQQHRSRRAARESGRKPEQLQIVNFEEILNWGRFGHSHHPQIS